MTQPTLRNVVISHLAIGGVVGAIVLNLLLRTFVKLGGVVATVAAAALVAAGMALWFRWREQRPMQSGERWRLLGLYSGILGVLYLGLLGMMMLKEDPSPMGTLLFALHYFCYPLLAWLFTRPGDPQ